jgi:YesN/AraC family two-component response regulator
MPDKILVVDDDEAFREELKASLTEYDTIDAPNGQEALKILSKPNEIDLVLLDMKMPGLNGTEILKLIKKRESDLGVIMVTGYASKDTAIDALRGQADDYLEKPADIDKLKETIERVLETKKYRNNFNNTNDMNQKIERVKRYIERNCFKKVTLDDAANIVDMNPKYLSRVFNDVAGISFIAYKLKIKIDRAKEMLMETGATVSQVSDKLGFMNPESFMRIFKKNTRMTPSEFKNKKKR